MISLQIRPRDAGLPILDVTSSKKMAAGEHNVGPSRRRHEVMFASGWRPLCRGIGWESSTE
jgi:hypothetical protein